MKPGCRTAVTEARAAQLQLPTARTAARRAGLDEPATQSCIFGTDEARDERSNLRECAIAHGTGRGSHDLIRAGFIRCQPGGGNVAPMATGRAGKDTPFRSDTQSAPRKINPVFCRADSACTGWVQAHRTRPVFGVFRDRKNQLSAKSAGGFSAVLRANLPASNTAPRSGQRKPRRNCSPAQRRAETRDTY